MHLISTNSVIISVWCRVYIVALRAAYSSRYSLYYSSPEITAYPPIKLRNDDDARERVHVYARILIGLTLIKNPLKIVANLLSIKEHEILWIYFEKFCRTFRYTFNFETEINFDDR